MIAIKKITRIFLRFPFINNKKVEDYIKYLKLNLFRKNDLSLYFPHTECSIYLSCNKIGDFCKDVSVNESTFYKYSCSFIPLKGKNISVYFVEKRIVDEICNKVIKFIMTAGRDKSDLPLLINVFPELANYFLQY